MSPARFFLTREQFSLGAMLLIAYGVSQVSTSAAQTRSPYAVRNLGQPINTNFNEFAPTITADGRTLFFTSSRPGGLGLEDLWMSLRSEDGDTVWSEPINLSELNSSVAEGAVSLAADGQSVFFATNQNTLINGDVNLWEATLEGVYWSHPTILRGNINTKKWDSQPSISPDGRSLYFASNRPGKIGSDSLQNVDIFVSHRASDGSWGNPVNLGSKINTPGYDASPFIARDGVTLYFASAGHNSIGGLDIFRSEWVGPTDTDWTEPEGLPEPINSKGNEIFPTVGGSGLSLMFASDRDGGSGRYDLWEATKVESIPAASADAGHNLQLSVNPTTVSSYYRVSVNFAAVSDFTLSVLDVTGREVSELARGRSAGGSTEFKFDARTLPSGNYIIRLTSRGAQKIIPISVVH